MPHSDPSYIRVILAQLLLIIVPVLPSIFEPVVLIVIGLILEVPRLSLITNTLPIVPTGKVIVVGVVLTTPIKYSLRVGVYVDVLIRVTGTSAKEPGGPCGPIGPSGPGGPAGPTWVISVKFISSPSQGTLGNKLGPKYGLDGIIKGI
jgi:hypothetical protein